MRDPKRVQLFRAWQSVQGSPTDSEQDVFAAWEKALILPRMAVQAFADGRIDWSEAQAKESLHLLGLCDASGQCLETIAERLAREGDVSPADVSITHCIGPRSFPWIGEEVKFRSLSTNWGEFYLRIKYLTVGNGSAAEHAAFLSEILGIEESELEKIRRGKQNLTPDVYNSLIGLLSRPSSLELIFDWEDYLVDPRTILPQGYPVKVHDKWLWDDAEEEDEELEEEDDATELEETEEEAADEDEGVEGFEELPESEDSDSPGDLEAADDQILDSTDEPKLQSAEHVRAAGHTAFYLRGESELFLGVFRGTLVLDRREIVFNKPWLHTIYWLTTRGGNALKFISKLANELEESTTLNEGLPKGAYSQAMQLWAITDDGEYQFATPAGDWYLRIEKKAVSISLRLSS